MLDQDLTIDELKSALFSMPNNKTPGCDGLPAEIYKILWPQIAEEYFLMTKAVIMEGKMSKSAKCGVITLMPKKGKDELYLKNWRSLTMLNVDYKILAKALATRIKKVLPSIIDEDQTGFMSERNIVNNIRKSMEMLEFTDVMQIPSVLMSIDYEKCFDRIHHNSIWAAMEQLGFGTKFIGMVKTLFTEFESCIVSNGHISEFFPITRSVHQGSPISSFLFLICAQLLTYMIKTNEAIKGIDMGHSQHKISQFADDTDMYLLFEEETINSVVETMKVLEHNVGLKVNYDKTTIYRMGSIAHSNAKLYTVSAFQWINTPPNILGVDIVKYEDNEMIYANFKEIFEKAETTLNNWKYRNISLSGKVLIVNTLIASLFVYRMSVLPNVPYQLITQFETMIDNFLGNGRKCRIPLSLLKLPREEGGLQLVDLFKRQMSLKAQWVVTIRDNPTWAAIAHQNLDPVFGELIWKCNLQAEDVNTLFPGSFWKQVLYAWALVNYKVPQTDEQIAGQIIWYNSHIKVQGSVVINKLAYNNGLMYVKDLFSPQGTLYTYNELLSVYGNCMNWFQHTQIIAALPHHWKQYLLADNSIQVDSNTLIDRLSNETKITKIVYKNLISESDYIDKPRMRWQARLAEPVFHEEFVRAFKSLNALTISTKHRDFQFRLMHNAVITNHQLYLWKIIDSDRCTFCGDSKEHTLHLFIQCTQVSRLWKRLQDWLIHELDIPQAQNLNWSPKNIIFNTVHPTSSHVINFIVLITKQYIYRKYALKRKSTFIN